MRRARRLALACAPFVVAPSLAHAQAVTTAPPPASVSQEQLISILNRLEAVEKRNAELEAEVRDMRAKAAANVPPKPAATDAKATLADARPTLATADKAFTASIRGIVQLDAAVHDQDPPGPLASDFRRGSFGDASEADHARDLSDGTNFRRVRLGVEGTLWRDWAYNVLVDFGGSGVEEPGRIINAYLDYTGFDPVRVRVGAFAPNVSFDEGTGAAASLFLERPAPADIVRNITGSDGREALALSVTRPRWMLYGAVTGNIVQTASFDDQMSLVGRATYLPWRNENGLLHLGVNANVVVQPASTGPGDAPTPLRLRERPETRVDTARLIDTGALDAAGLTILGAEVGWQHRALSLQGEYFHFDLDRRGPLADPDFDGWYIQAAWTLTGQPRRYNANGGFDPPAVREPFDLRTGRWGVFEIAARVSDMDLNFMSGAPGSAPVLGAVRGGDQRGVTLGLNWYPNNNIRFLADYERVQVDRLSPGGAAFGAGVLTPPAGAQVGQDLSIWSLRTQLSF